MNSDGLGVVYITLTKSPTPSVQRKQIRRRNEHKRNRGGRSHTSPESMMTMKCSDEGHRNIILPETPCISTLLPRASKVRGGEGRTDRGREGRGILHTEGKRGRKSGRKSARIFVPSLPLSLCRPSVLLRGPKVGRSPQGLRRESVEGERGIRQLYPRGFLEQGRARSQRVREGRGPRCSRSVGPRPRPLLVSIGDEEEKP